MPEGPGLPSGVIQLRNLVVGRLKRPSLHAGGVEAVVAPHAVDQKSHHALSLFAPM